MSLYIDLINAISISRQLRYPKPSKGIYIITQWPHSHTPSSILYPVITIAHNNIISPPNLYPKHRTLHNAHPVAITSNPTDARQINIRVHVQPQQILQHNMIPR